jgi:hypothetical protein
MNVAFVLALACTPTQTPALTCAEALVDRGSLRGGPAITQSFEVVNRGAAELAIVHSQPSCGCLAPQISSRALKPGQSAAVRIHIGTLSQPEGENLWTVRIFYRIAGSEVDRTLDLQVKAKLTREVGIEPAALRLAGKPGLAHEITLTDLRAKPLEISGVATSSGRISAIIEQEWQAAGRGWQRKIRVMLTPECPTGKSEEIVQIFSLDPDYREMRLSVTVVRTDRQRFQVTPGEFTIDARAHSPAGATVLIRDPEGQPIEIEQAEPADPALVCHFAPGPLKVIAISLATKEGQTPMRFSVLRVYVKQPMAQTVNIPVTFSSGK